MEETVDVDDIIGSDWGRDATAGNTHNAGEGIQESNEAEFRSAEDFSPLEVIGTGSFCSVLLCTDKVSGLQYAMKDVPKTGGPTDQAFVVESHCLRQLEASPFVVSLLWDFDLITQWVGIFELANAGELWKTVDKTGSVLEGEVAWFASQMVEALCAVHAAGIVHRDVKCENFVVFNPGRVLKMIDFGTARDTNYPQVKPMHLGPQFEHHVGTPNFMAPEAIANRANDRLSDLWSLGCAIYQLALGMLPFGAPTAYAVLLKAQSGNLWLPSHGLTGDLRNLTEQLVQVDPSHRDTSTGDTDELRRHPLLATAPAAAPEATPVSRALRLVALVVANERQVAAALALREAEAAELVAAQEASAEGAVHGDREARSPTEAFDFAWKIKASQVRQLNKEAGSPSRRSRSSRNTNDSGDGSPRARRDSCSSMWSETAGESIAKLLEELPMVAAGNDVANALLSLVRHTASVTIDAGKPWEFIMQLAEAAANGTGEAAKLPNHTRGHLVRFAEQAMQQTSEMAELPFDVDHDGDEEEESTAEIEDVDAEEDLEANVDSEDQGLELCTEKPARRFSAREVLKFTIFVVGATLFVIALVVAPLVFASASASE